MSSAVGMCVRLILCLWVSDVSLFLLASPQGLILETNQGSWLGMWTLRVGLEAVVRAGWCCFVWGLGVSSQQQLQL